jgi:hypothetical protein
VLLRWYKVSVIQFKFEYRGFKAAARETRDDQSEFEL